MIFPLLILLSLLGALARADGKPADPLTGTVDHPNEKSLNDCVVQFKKEPEYAKWAAFPRKDIYARAACMEKLGFKSQKGSQVALLQNGKLGEEGADYLQTKKTP